MSTRHTIDLDLDVGDDGDTEPCVVHFSVQPREQATRDYPGCPESVEVFSIICENGGELYGLLPDDFIADLEKRILAGEFVED